MSRVRPVSRSTSSDAGRFGSTGRAQGCPVHFTPTFQIVQRLLAAQRDLKLEKVGIGEVVTPLSVPVQLGCPSLEVQEVAFDSSVVSAAGESRVSRSPFKRSSQSLGFTWFGFRHHPLGTPPKVTCRSHFLVHGETQEGLR